MRLESSLPVSVWPVSFLRVSFWPVSFLRVSVLPIWPVLVASVLLLLLGSLTTAAHARSGREDVFDVEQSDRFTDPFVAPFGRATDDRSSGGRAQGDTIWFGGHDGAGHAVEGSVWDFEGGATGDFQGWTSIDCTENLDTYFGRVTAEDFATDPVVPMMNAPDSQGQIWCGIHEAEANELGFVTGMGYGNSYCQGAFSSAFPVGAVGVAFDYFQDSEFEWDYTYVFVRCLDGAGDLLPDGEVELARFTGIHGSPEAPASWSGSLGILGMPPGTEQVQLELRFDSDGAWSDEDGLYDCLWGAFAADNILLEVAGSPAHLADFEAGPDGYTFGKCPGVGSYMGLVDEGTYTLWLDALGLTCLSPLTGWAIEFNDEEGSPYPFPGHPSGQREMGVSPIIDRTAVGTEEFNATVVEWDQFTHLDCEQGTFYRMGYMVYPYTTPVNPEPHWSGRLGQDTYLYSSTINCQRYFTNLSTLDGNAGTPLPSDYEQMRFVYEIYCSCAGFGIPSTVCIEEGNNRGSPVLDNVRVGLTTRVDAPSISPSTGHWFHDGYGQTVPTYLDPADVGNSNVSYDLSPVNSYPDEQNDWLADSAMVAGPTVNAEDERWLVELCFRVARKGPMQDLIPAYAAWKARLTGDPEDDFVCVLMDSLETAQGPWRNKFVTYFHEDDPGFDPAYGDRRPQQEILPDSIWTPGTRIHYYYRSYWYNGGAPAETYFVWPTGYPEPVATFEILPNMRVVSEDPYEIQWPSILYVDAHNRGAEYYIRPMLDQAGLEYDQYDYLFASSSWHAPLARSYGGTHFNPGGYGNNGLTLEQALGYRLIILDTGHFGLGMLEAKDWPLFLDWVQATECGALDTRRGLLFSGCGLAQLMEDYGSVSQELLHDVFGATLLDHSFREYSGVEDWCARLETSSGAPYSVETPLTLRGNGCPTTIDFDVLGLSGAAGAMGNLDYGDGGSTWPYAQVVRDGVVSGESNWRSALLGFSLMYLGEDGCQGEVCSGDSACVVGAGTSFLEATLAWMTEGAEPFELWSQTCSGSSVPEEEETHLAGAVTHLFAARPNPIQRTAAIRFHLARDEHVRLSIYDVSGRLVRELVDAKLSGGEEHTVRWDGAADSGSPAGSGVFWMQLATESGYRSCKRLIVMR